jgi:hypothetical protein
MPVPVAEVILGVMRAADAAVPERIEQISGASRAVRPDFRRGHFFAGK